MVLLFVVTQVAYFKLNFSIRVAIFSVESLAELHFTAMWLHGITNQRFGKIVVMHEDATGYSV